MLFQKNGCQHTGETALAFPFSRVFFLLGSFFKELGLQNPFSRDLGLAFFKAFLPGQAQTGPLHLQKTRRLHQYGLCPKP